MGIEIEVEATAGIKTGEAARDAALERRMANWAKISRAIDVPGSFQSQAAAPTYSFLSFPPVTNGKLWELLKVAASGTDPFTAQASPWFGFVAQDTPQDSAVEPPFPDMLFPPFATLPNVYYIASRRGYILNPLERVVLCFKSLPNTFAVTGSLHAIEHDAERYMMELGG